MVEFLHFDIQSTGQKSHCVNSALRSSQCYVLIRQSDSPCPHQFQVGLCEGKYVCTALPPDPWSQSFSQSYGSILPTSLTYIVLSTRGCTPWRPAAVISTTGCKGKTIPRIFTDRQRRTGQSKTLCSSDTQAASPAKPFPRRSAVNKKRKLFPEPLPTSPGSPASPPTLQPAPEY